MDRIDGISIDRIVREYGSPVFIVSAEILRRNVRAFREEFSKRYPSVEVAYSYKTNYLPGVLRIIHEEGTWAEVASGFEYDLARAIGVSGKSIVFNGPCKRKEEIEKASREGALINVDHMEELKLLEEIASGLRRTLDIGIRVNANLGIHQLSDRFGFNLESGEAAQIVEMCARSEPLRVVGLHIHLTSYIFEPDEGNSIPAKRIRLIWPKGADMYGMATEKIVRFAEEIRKRFGVRIRYVDMGGGFPSVDSLTPYVEAIVEPIIHGFEEWDSPILILEPGRAIVRDAVHLIATVVGVKWFPDGRRGIVIDAGINLLPTSFWGWQEIEPVMESDSKPTEATVYGPLCLQTDIVGKANLPELKAGDRLVIKNVGAYNTSQSSSFIFPRPFSLLIENGRVEVLRRAETVKDILLET
jgi:diaminopimelate decarboxylase